MSRDAVIVSTARTPIGRAYKGAFNATPGATLGAFSLAPAIERAGIDAGEIDDRDADLISQEDYGSIIARINEAKERARER